MKVVTVKSIWLTLLTVLSFVLPFWGWLAATGVLVQPTAGSGHAGDGKET
ncbi:hypothetical protein [Lactobacillus delbrueckii]|nr:hypothetical protein [Lactobacillus delbrueckii]MCD5533364.1 hypothetical protein [Lactobacillus delbrueckii subsp. lactis]